MTKRTPGFKKGDPNINRAGRPKGAKTKDIIQEDLDKKILKLGPQAITWLTKLLQDPKLSAQQRLKIIFYILDYNKETYLRQAELKFQKKINKLQNELEKEKTIDRVESNNIAYFSPTAVK